MSEPVRIEIEDAPPIEAAMAIVACDPRSLVDVMPMTGAEREIVAGLVNFRFFTTCLRVRPRRVQDRSVILDPVTCAEMRGLVHGYRNETAKQWGLEAANAQETNVVVTYQIVGVGDAVAPDILLERLEAFLVEPPAWWPFEPGRYEIVRVEEDQPHGGRGVAANPLCTPYFDHFGGSDLLAGKPWDWIGLQGDHATLYVHASTCFESVLHCWSYLDVLEADGLLNAALPARKDATIAVIGAGVSGLLSAVRLKSLGYTSVVILEREARYGGKTHSLPVPDDLGVTTSELGTCYMSPAYDGMIDRFRNFDIDGRSYDFTAGNTRIPVGEDGQRGIVVDGGADVVAFADYGMRKACEWLGVADDVLGRLDADVALVVAAEQYVRIRTEVFGSLNGVMPLERPTGDPYGIFSRSFLDFLRANEMGVLQGYLEYAYQVQGYGDLTSIPAYYGLVWITPNIAWPFGRDAGVTAWTLGWENVWEQMVEKLDLDVRRGTRIVAVAREGVGTAASGSAPEDRPDGPFPIPRD